MARHRDKRALPRVAHHQVVGVRRRLEAVDRPRSLRLPGEQPRPAPTATQVSAGRRARRLRTRRCARAWGDLGRASSSALATPSLRAPRRRGWPRPHGAGGDPRRPRHTDRQICALAVTSGAAVVASTMTAAASHTLRRRVPRGPSARIRVTRRTNGESPCAIGLVPPAPRRFPATVQAATAERQRANASGGGCAARPTGRTETPPIRLSRTRAMRFRGWKKNARSSTPARTRQPGSRLTTCATRAPARRAAVRRRVAPGTARATRLVGPPARGERHRSRSS